jgi:hypothetical protein
VTTFRIDELIVALFVSTGKAFDGFAKETANAHEAPTASIYLRIGFFIFGLSGFCIYCLTI